MRHDSIKKLNEHQSNNLPELSEKKKKILLFIANSGEANIYQIAEKCAMGYSTAHSSVKALEKDGLLRLESERINKKGVPATIYALTKKGIHRSIFELPTWHEKTLVTEKWQSLLHTNVLEWMKFIEALGDLKIESMANNSIGSFLSYSDDLGYFVDVIDETFFESILAVMIEYEDSHSKVMEKINSYPRIKDRLLIQLAQELQWNEDYLERFKRIKAKFEDG